jgi:predicted MFS family arabinose efflux permease
MRIVLMPKEKRALIIFFVVLALSGLGLGLSDSVFANFFKDAYHVDAFQRGVIEFPRELPGFLVVFVVSAFSFLGDIRLSIIAQMLSILGLLALGLLTPVFSVMLIFLFVNSMGMHLFMPVSDGIALSFAEKGGFGSMMGRFNGVRIAFTMIAGVLVFFGFKVGFFSFTTPIKLIFLVAAGIFTIILCLLLYMRRLSGAQSKTAKFKLVIRKEYGMFYLLAILFGARKQIMYVYGPWVLIELLGFGADTMALLAITGAAVGIFLMPAVGRWIDRFGTARVMAFEAAAFFIIYAAYGFLSAGLSGGWLLAAGFPVVAAFVINMTDRMTIQFGMVRSVYMCQVAVSPEEVTPTLSVGMTLDHALSILSAFLCGMIWKEWGPQYVFVLAALLSVANFSVARRLKKRVVI